MRHPIPLACTMLIVVGLACETPEGDESPQTVDEGERETRQRRAGDDSETDALAFESLPASDDGTREALLYAAPDDPRALFWIFHGRGDSREWCRRPHIQPALRAFHDDGFAIHSARSATPTRTAAPPTPSSTPPATVTTTPGPYSRHFGPSWEDDGAPTLAPDALSPF